jgi:3-phenylpropionate/trans-cinnamate dioxygenase ferredoxin component
MAGEFVRVALLSDIPPGALLGVEVNEKRICLANVEDEIYAFQDNCSHKDFPLSAGRIDDGKLECAWHGAMFDVHTGKALSLPAIKPIRTYEVKVEGGQIFIAVE